MWRCSLLAMTLRGANRSFSSFFDSAGSILMNCTMRHLFELFTKEACSCPAEKMTNSPVHVKIAISSE